jgi:hypothetical protein
MATKPTPSWRDVLPIHPAAELFPRMSEDELRALGEDIVKNGLNTSIALWRGDPKGQAQLLDGRNRLDALELVTGGPVVVGAPSIMAGKDFLACDKVIVLDKSVDPYAYVISANIRRRHLSAKQKRDLITELIKATPEKSDRQIAEMVKASPTTVGAVREKMETSGDVSKLDTRQDTKGRQQPAKKKKPAVPSASAKRGAIAAEKSQAEEIAKRQAKAAQQDIGPASASELAREDAELGILRSARRRIELENVGLRSEVESASETDDEEAQQLGGLLRAWDRASVSAREKFMARNGLQRAAPSDDGSAP